MLEKMLGRSRNGFVNYHFMLRALPAPVFVDGLAQRKYGRSVAVAELARKYW